ncbi:motility associated factor glycosyltransferase family protein [Heliobacterium chlorum]|uniref:Motility associated factor glycosyltransferase family protein n=1 Tax=Heliobacterium chlorum TaxID=2698 RepID=A0ABR7T0Y5_HELCL|nr:6-hydroxymethylpterin diphosphokinase MptE-like protein [Heliobacterium chlorum]MBC9784453.1 motility associated factor glycosyltransferase family protein [Heliobacterium chlorum]
MSEQVTDENFIGTITESLWKKNLDHLKQYRIDLFEQLTEMAQHHGVTLDALRERALAEDTHFLPCKRRGYTLVRQHEGKKIFLHSQYDSSREAEDWAAEKLRGYDKEKQGKVDHIFLMGIGLGYHLLDLCRQKDTEGLIIAFESRIEYFVYSLSINDWTSIIESNKVKLLFGSPAKDYPKTIGDWLDIYHLESVRLVDYTPVKKWDEPFYQEIAKEILAVIKRLATQLHTILFFSDYWVENVLRNLPHAFNAPGAGNLFGKFEGIPAIVVAAGPSLSKVLPELQKWKAHAILIAVDTAMRPLLQAGIEPDFVVAIDGSKLNHRHFEGVQCKAPLIFDFTTYWEISDSYIGPRMINFTRGIYKPLFPPDLFERNVIESGPSVAHVSYHFARQMGCNPVIFVGQDLCYVDGFTHAEGTALRKKEEQGGKLISVVNMYGEAVNTTGPFIIFKEQFETYFELFPNTKVYNASIGGLSIKGAPEVRLENIPELSNDPRLIEESRKRIQEMQNRGPLIEEKEPMIDDLRIVLEEMDKAKELCKKGLELTKQMWKLYDDYDSPVFQKEIGQILDDLDSIDQELKQFTKINWLLASPFQWHYYAFFRRADVMVDEEESISGKKAAETSRILYQTIDQMVNKYYSIVEESLERIIAIN